MSTPPTPTDEVDVDELPEEEREPWWQRLVTGQSTAIALILIGLIAVFSFLKPEEFLDVNNARNIATDAAVLLVLAVGLTFVIITAGIDLSVGAVLVFSGVVAAKVMNEMGGDNWGVILVGLGVALASGLGWGLLNGFLVAKAKIPAFIVTLGTLGMALGSALLITSGVDQRDVPFKLIDTVGSGRAFGEIPYLVVFLILASLTDVGRKSAGAAAMTTASAEPAAASTSVRSCSVVSTRTTLTPAGSGRAVFAANRVTSAPRAAAARARA